jgi:hypothetical protein
MDSEKIQKTIIINNQEIVVVIDKVISSEKSKIIMDNFCKHLKQMKLAVKKISKFKPSDFDYIVIMLIVKHCTDFLKSDIYSFVDLTIKYSELVTKNIIQQIFKGMSETEISKSIDKVMVSCRLIVQNEISVTKLEGFLPQLTDGENNINIIKINKDKLSFSKEKLEKMISNHQDKQKKQTIEQNLSFDDLLDEYSDAKFLYNMFGDEEYHKKMRSALSKMRRRWKKSYGEKNSP